MKVCIILYVVQQLEKQLARLYQLNPTTFANDEFNDKIREDDSINEQEKERILEMASLMNSSQLLKSYEQLIQQFECDFEMKNARIRDMERELQQIQVENSNLAQQLYNVKTQHSMGG